MTGVLRDRVSSAVQTSAPGVIGGAVVRASRQSAGLTTLRLARSLKIGVKAVLDLEKGFVPLFCLPYDQLRHLAECLRPPHPAIELLFAELIRASQCDLLVTGLLLGFEDFAEVPPADEDNQEGRFARDLLSWAFRGIVPMRYHGVADPSCLLTAADCRRIAAILHDIRAGEGDTDLARYAETLSALL